MVTGFDQIGICLFDLIKHSDYPSPKDDQVGDLEIIKLRNKISSLNSRTHPRLFDVIYNIKEKL